MDNVVFNKCQTPLEELELGKYPAEVQEQFWDFINNVPFIKWMVSPDRPLVSELPRDEYGRAIIDVSKPPILEDSSFFRQTALGWQENGKYTNLRPNSNPNSEFGRWLREERRRGWEGYVNPSNGMWVTGDYYWVLNYCPMHLVVKRDDGLEMRTTRHPNFWDGQFFASHYIQQARQKKHHAAYLASRGKGKAHPYSQIVYTPDGIKRWGDIKVGDVLFGDDGNLTTVTAIPFDAEEKIYTVTLSDGRKLQCTSGHNFYVKDHRKHPCMRVVDLWEIMHTDYAHKRKDGGIEYYYSIPNNKKVEFAPQNVMIDPYTLGLLLGDGGLTNCCLNTARFTSHKDDIETYKNNIPYEIIEHKAKHDYGIRINNVLNILEEYRLLDTRSDTKFIPKEYLFNSSEVRMSILQGLMDTDGTVNNSGVPMFSTTSKQLAKDIRWLCHSLGYNSTMFTKQGKYRDNKGEHICKINYNITILTNDPIFRLQRKLNRLDGFKTNYGKSRRDWTKIVDIKYSHREKAKCVLVDNKSHCYLIGDFIVTHNTTLGGGMLAKRFIIGEFENNRREIQCLVTAADKTKLIGVNQILSVFIDNIDFAAKNTQFASHRLKSSLQELTWQMGYKKSGSDVAYGSKNSVQGIISGVNQDKLNGSRGVLYIIEEAGIFRDLNDLYGLIRPSVEQGSSVFGEILLYGCVCAGTKVWTNDGRYINIEDLHKEDGIIGYENDLPVRNTIGTLLEPRQKPCIRIEWENGGYLECSTDHPILKQIVHAPRVNGSNVRKRTPEEVWVRADGLKVGDRIIEGRRIGAFGNDTLEDARLIGMLIGDGSYGHDNTPKFSSEDEELLNYIKERYEWGISDQHITKEGRLYQDIRVKGICPLLRKVGIYTQTKTAKRLPTKYQTLTEEDTKLLLAGLYDTDGCVTGMGNKALIELTQASKEILEQVAILLRKFGIISSIAKNKPSIKEGRIDKNPWYILSIGGRTNIELFYENIPLMQHRKMEKMGKIHQWFVEHPLIKARCYDEKKVIPRTIRKIESLGIQTIYNLSAEQSHTYLANNIVTHNTAGNEQSDFTAFAEMFYSPDGYNLCGMDNVFDKEGQGRKQTCFFYPVYMNYDDTCIDKDGNSDITKALLMVCNDRYKVKYGSSDINAITKRISQYPITPQEAIIRSQGNTFPVTELNNRLNQIDNNPGEYDDVYVGELIQKDGGIVEFQPTGDIPIREFPTKDNKVLGALEIFEMPQKSSDGKIPFDRYIGGLDPFDDDQSGTMSLGSFFVLDTWTDRIVAEYTGRPMFANDLYEKIRLLCIFYNMKVMYENNLKGIFGYFSQRNCTYMLADTPEYLKDKQLITTIGYGNKGKGCRATTPIIKAGFRMIRDWLLKPITKIEKDIDGNEIEVTMPNLYNIRCRALLKELIQWNPYGNYDRVMALVQLMLYREEKMILYQGNIEKSKSDTPGLEEDDYFTRNYKPAGSKFSNPFRNSKMLF